MNFVRRIVGSIRRRLKPDPLGLRSALSRCQRRGTQVRTFFDIGASNGSWTVTAQRYFPGARWVLIEAQPEHELSLYALKRANADVDYVLAAAGDIEGELYFDGGDLFGGVASHEPVGRRCIVVPSVTVDGLVERMDLEPPFGLKLDTHGFEVPILEGAARTLRRASLVVIEAYNFEMRPGSLRFQDLCDFMERRGFRCVDLCDPMHRPRDGTFWQIDLFFVPSSDAVFASNTFE